MAFNRISSFGSNDSGYESGGIVEVFEEPQRTLLKNPDHAKEVARRRQHLMASELSRLDAEEYQDEILEHMLKMDVSTDTWNEGIDLHSLTCLHSSRPCPMSTRSIFKLRFSGS